MFLSTRDKILPLLELKMHVSSFQYWQASDSKWTEKQKGGEDGIGCRRRTAANVRHATLSRCWKSADTRIDKLSDRAILSQLFNFSIDDYFKWREIGSFAKKELIIILVEKFLTKNIKFQPKYSSSSLIDRKGLTLAGKSTN